MDNIELHISEKHKTKTEVIDAGTLIEYLFGNMWKKAQVSHVHYDDDSPYYSILLEKDNVIIERRTVREKIRYPERTRGSRLPPLFRRGSMPFRTNTASRRISPEQVLPYQ